MKPTAYLIAFKSASTGPLQAFEVDHEVAQDFASKHQGCITPLYTYQERDFHPAATALLSSEPVLTKREELAKAMAQGILASDTGQDLSTRETVERAIQMADALLDRLEPSKVHVDA